MGVIMMPVGKSFVPIITPYVAPVHHPVQTNATQVEQPAVPHEHGPECYVAWGVALALVIFAGWLFYKIVKEL